jgi:hypothetical protein
LRAIAFLNLTRSEFQIADVLIRQRTCSQPRCICCTTLGTLEFKYEHAGRGSMINCRATRPRPAPIASRVASPFARKLIATSSLRPGVVHDTINETDNSGIMSEKNVFEIDNICRSLTTVSGTETRPGPLLECRRSCPLGFARHHRSMMNNTFVVFPAAITFLWEKTRWINYAGLTQRGAGAQIDRSVRRWGPQRLGGLCRECKTRWRPDVRRAAFVRPGVR